jgi:hypothetical protein
MKDVRTVAQTFAVIALVSVGVSSASAPQEEGFQEIPWGTPLARLEQKFELSPLSKEGECHRYSSNVRQVGTAKVSDCEFEFVRDEFAGVAILTSGPRNTHRLLAYLKKLFGEGHQESPRAYQWFSGQTHVFYDEDSDGDGYIYWYSRKLLTERQ